MKWPVCVMCGANNNLHHHHVIPRSQGGSNDQNNLITVCAKCHAIIHGMPSHTWVHNQEMKKRTERKNRKKRKFNGGTPKLTTFTLERQRDIFEKISGRSRNMLRNQVLFLLIVSKVRINEICMLKWKHIVGNKIKIPDHGEVVIKKDLILLLKKLSQQDEITKEDFIIRTERAEKMQFQSVSNEIQKWCKL